MSTTGKTPVSLLNETLIRRGVQPIYKLTQDAVGTNQGVFKYEVSAGDLFAAVGQGRSKKEAKQQAAKAALETLKMGGASAPEPINEDSDTEMNVVSPYEAELKVNAVGLLSEVCDNHDMPPPDYEQIREDGPPHAKFFEFCCRVASVQVFAVGRTKKQAKQLAASQMLQNLKLNLDDIVPGKPTELLNSPMDTLSLGSQSGAANSDSVVRFPLGLRVGQGFRHDWSAENIAALQSYRGPFEDPMATLKEICQELGIDADLTQVESTSEDMKLVMLSLTTMPINVTMGFGTTEEEAVEMAADMAITFLQKMTS